MTAAPWHLGARDSGSDGQGDQWLWAQVSPSSSPSPLWGIRRVPLASFLQDPLILWGCSFGVKLPWTASLPGLQEGVGDAS